MEAASWTKTLVPVGSKGSIIEVKFAFDGCVGRKASFFAGRVDQVESKHQLGDGMAPLLGGEVGVARGKYSANMIFECVDHTFGGVAAVVIWGDKL